MRLGNAAVDNCSNQGLPDFYFFLFLSSLPLSPLLSFSRSAFLLSPAHRPYAPSCSLPPAPPRAAREREGGSVVEAAAVEAEEAHTETLICFFRYSPYFPPRPPRTNRRCLLSRALFLLLSLLPFFFHFFFSSHAIRIPSPDCNSAGLSAPRNSSLFLLRCSAPPARLSPILFLSPQPQRSCSSSFYPRCSRVLSSFLSFFPSFFPCCSRCPWSVISRRGGDENARLGLRAVASSFCRRLPPPSASSSSYSIRLRSFLALFFPFFPSPLPVPAPFLTPRVIRSPRSRDREKYIDCEQRMAERSHCRDVYRGYLRS